MGKINSIKTKEGRKNAYSQKIDVTRRTKRKSRESNDYGRIMDDGKNAKIKQNKFENPAGKKSAKIHKRNRVKNLVPLISDGKKSDDNQLKNCASSCDGGSLLEKMSEKLRGARFRYINECLYTKMGSESMRMFSNDPNLFEAYHDGFEMQKQSWPIDPLDILIQQLNKMSRKVVIADMGCGSARLAASVAHTVHSYDLMAANERVTVCDMAKVPLADDSVDICVYCLSLMGTNLCDYLIEANRILKPKGFLKIVEISSRFKSIRTFRRDLEKLGFQLVYKGSVGDDDYFLQLDFEKASKPKKKCLPGLALNPCQYKKR